MCKTDNFVPLVVPGLSTSCGSNSSETSTSQDLSSTSPPQERSDELAPRRWCGEPSETQKKIKRGMKVEMLTTVCEIFLSRCWSSPIIWRTQNCMHPHTFLRTPERATKVVSKSRQHGIYTHFPKRPKMRSLPANQNDKGSLQ